MNKTKLSSNLLAEKIVIVISFIMLLLLGIGLEGFSKVICLIPLFVIGYSIYSIYFVVSKLWYDQTLLYIKNRNIDKSVPLKGIIVIKITPYWGSWRNQWKITYIEENKEEFIFFYLKYGLFSLTPFIKSVKTQNPQVDCIYITPTIDFD